MKRTMRTKVLKLGVQYKKFHKKGRFLSKSYQIAEVTGVSHPNTLAFRKNFNFKFSILESK